MTCNFKRLAAIACQILAAGFKNEALCLLQAASKPMPLQAKPIEFIVKKQIADFYISPDGEIYPTRPFEHWMTSDLIFKEFYPKIEDPSEKSAEDKGWIHRSV